MSGLHPSVPEGPWEAKLEAVRFVIQHKATMGKRGIAYTGGYYPDNPYVAYLIAAAPELYEALRDMVALAEPYFTDAPQTLALNAATTALARARGEPL